MLKWYFQFYPNFLLRIGRMRWFSFTSLSMKYDASIHEIRCIFPWNTMHLSMKYDASFHEIRCIFPWNTMHLSMKYDASFHEIRCTFSWNTIHLLLIRAYLMRLFHIIIMITKSLRCWMPIEKIAHIIIIITKMRNAY